jgi:hypothetical protein
MDIAASLCASMTYAKRGKSASNRVASGQKAHLYTTYRGKSGPFD